MSRRAREILRLTHCPQCGYDLAGLPQNHQCPECGFAYDESMFVVGADPVDHRIEIGAVDFFAAMAILVPALVMVGSLRMRPLVAGGIFCMLILLVFLILTRGRTHDGFAGRRTRSLFVTRDGHQSLATLSRGLRPWSNFRRAKITRILFHLQLAPPGAKPPKPNASMWNLRILRPFWIGLVLAPIDIRLSCTKREAALIRNEIRGRIRAARGGAPRDPVLSRRSFVKSLASADRQSRA